MSDPQNPSGGDSGIDATGVDADFVTNDPAPEPDESTPGTEQTSDDDEVDVADLP